MSSQTLSNELEVRALRESFSSSKGLFFVDHVPIVSFVGPSELSCCSSLDNNDIWADSDGEKVHFVSGVGQRG